MPYCLPKFAANEFKKALKSGDLQPEKLTKMSAEDRKLALAKYVGKENVNDVNTLLEGKMRAADLREANLASRNEKAFLEGKRSSGDITPAQNKRLGEIKQQGLVNWIKSTTGDKPAIQNDLLSRVKRMGTILDPKSEDAFYNDLVNSKLGIDVTEEESRKISELAQSAKTAELNIDRSLPDNAPERFDLGMKKVAFDNYIHDLKFPQEEGFTGLIKDTVQGGKDFITAPFEEKLKTILNTPVTLGGIAKSLKSTLDNSFLLHQGWKTFWDHPVLWSKNAFKSFPTAIEQAFKGGESRDVENAIKAEIFGRENSLNGNYRKMKLAIGTTEDQFPSSFVDRVPLAGRLTKASEVAFTGTAYRLRADLADQMFKLADRVGETDPNLEAMGEFINTSTGRGGLGVLERAAGPINSAFFSLRYLSSDIKLLTQVITGAGGGNFIRRQAAMRLVRAIGGTAAILGISERLIPGSVEWDPRSSDFGKIKIGSSRFDVTAGMGSIITLVDRLATGESKSLTTGKISKIGAQKNGKPVFGGKTYAGVIGDFALNKTAPLIGALIDLRNGYDRNANPINLDTTKGATNFGKELFEPLGIANAEEMLGNKNSAPLLLGIILDGLGVNENTYGK